MHIGLIDAVKLDLNLLQKLVEDALEILESNSGSVVLISTTLHYNQEATSINDEQCSVYKTRSSCGREKHEKPFVSTFLRASSGSLFGFVDAVGILVPWSSTNFETGARSMVTCGRT